MPPSAHRSRAPLAHPPRRAARARPPRTPRLPAAAGSSSQTNREAIPSRDRGPIRDRGLSLLIVFTVAMLVMVGLATLTAIVGRWWILVPVMAVDLAIVAAVLASVARLLNDGDGR